MKRDSPLVPLSREHHTALVLALHIARAADAVERRALCARAAALFDTQLARHFETEENEVLPKLAVAHADLVNRTLGEHHRLRELIRRVAQMDDRALIEFGTLLAAHTRFEERQVFPIFEAMSAAVHPVTAASFHIPS